MTITSLPFACFVLATLGVYYLAPARRQVGVLVAASYLFCATWGWQLVAALGGVTAMNLFVLSRLGNQNSARRTWFLLGVAANVASLLVLRTLPVSGTLVVVGASFYVLRGISLLADAYNGVLKAPSPSQVVLYLGYFPTLLAGPIEQAGPFVAGLRRRRIVDNAAVGRNLALIAVGTVRKLVIADPLATTLPAAATMSPRILDGPDLLWALLAYAFVLYNDFAGYTDTVRGVSGLFGIELTRNFAQPFFAHSFTDFWRRWHASLTRWLMSYVYMPLSRTLLRRRWGLRSPANILAPPLLTMLASGIWHGGSVGFLVWGGLHGTYLAAERVLSLRSPRRPGVQGGRWRQPLGVATVFALGCVALVPFWLPMDLAVDFWWGLTSWKAWAPPPRTLVLAVVAVLTLDALQARAGDENPFANWPRPARVAILAATLLVCFLASRGVAPAPFIYQGF